MPTEHLVSSGIPTQPDSHVIIDDLRQSRVAQWDQTVLDLEAMTDETDTPELWDEVLRTLRVDPTNGHGLTP